MQSPHDDWGFYSFAVCATRHDDDTRTFKSFLVYSDPDFSGLCRSIDFISDYWKKTDLPMVVMPLVLLRHQVQQTSRKLADVIRRVEEVESAVTASSQTVDFNDLVQKLHSCNTDLIKLERRWHFQDKLASSIQEFINSYKSPINSQSNNFSGCTFQGPVDFHHEGQTETNPVHAIEPQNDTYFRKLDSDSTLQGKVSRASEYDLGVLPRRVSNQFTAVRPLLVRYAQSVQLLTCSKDIQPHCPA